MSCRAYYRPGAGAARFLTRASNRSIQGPVFLVCPLCESHRPGDYIVVGHGSRPGDNGVEEFVIFRCRRDGVEFADALPNDWNEAGTESLDEMYGTTSDWRCPSRYDLFMNHLENVLGARPGLRLHDVGCGNGQLLIEARRRGWNVQGNDIVAGVKNRIESQGIKCLIGPLSQLDIEPESCDVVTSYCVLPHHLTDPGPDMRAAWGILRRGGWLVLQLPVDGLYRRVAKTIYRACWPWRPTSLARRALAEIYAPGGHQFAFTAENLTQYLQQVGFIEVKCIPYSIAARSTMARFTWQPLWYRWAAFIVIYTTCYASKIMRRPNHAIVFAQKSLGS